MPMAWSERSIHRRSPAGDLLDHQVALVAVGEVAVLLVVFVGGDHVVPQFARRVVGAHLRQQHVVAFRVAVEQDPVRPGDRVAGQWHRMRSL